jgi:hypothetical protein
MFKSHLALIVLATCAALPMVSKADTIVTYDFTYNGTGIYVPTETATGNGSITFDLSSLSSVKVTAFSFTDTLSDPTLGSSTFTYGLTDLSSVSDVFGGTLANPILTNLQLQTAYLTGTPNSNYSATDFNLAYSPAIAESTAGANGAKLADFTSGTTGIVRVDPSISAVPEPSSYLLFATGIMGVARLYKSRKHAGQAL